MTLSGNLVTEFQEVLKSRQETIGIGFSMLVLQVREFDG